MTYDEDVERVAEAMHAVDCGCDGSCGYPYREMAAAAIAALDLPAHDRRAQAEALRGFAGFITAPLPTAYGPASHIFARIAREKADEIEFAS